MCSVIANLYWFFFLIPSIKIFLSPPPPAAFSKILCKQRKDKLREHMQRMHNPEREAKKADRSSRSKTFKPRITSTDYDSFTFKCRLCMMGFRRRGMLVSVHRPTPKQSSVLSLSPAFLTGWAWWGDKQFPAWGSSPSQAPLPRLAMVHFWCFLEEVFVITFPRWFCFVCRAVFAVCFLFLFSSVFLNQPFFWWSPRPLPVLFCVPEPAFLVGSSPPAAHSDCPRYDTTVDGTFHLGRAWGPA